jgi:hypothetical protein
MNKLIKELVNNLINNIFNDEFDLSEIRDYGDYLYYVKSGIDKKLLRNKIIRKYIKEYYYKFLKDEIEFFVNKDNY